MDTIENWDHMQPGLAGGFVSALNKSYPSARLDGDFALDAEDHSPSLGDSGEQGYGLDWERSSRPGSLGEPFHRIVAIRSISRSPAKQEVFLSPKLDQVPGVGYLPICQDQFSTCRQWSQQACSKYKQQESGSSETLPRKTESKPVCL